MRDLILKIAKVKDEKSFYKKYPSEEAFMKIHGKEFKKAKMGAYIGGVQGDSMKPINFQDQYDQADYNATGSTEQMRNQYAAQQAQINAKNSGGATGDGFDIGQLSKIAGMFGGGDVPTAQFGTQMFNNNGFNPGNTSLPSNIGYGNNQSLTKSSGFNQMNAGQQFAQNNPLPQGVQNTNVPQNIGFTPQNKVQPKGKGQAIAEGLTKGAPIIGDIVQGIGMIKQQKNALRQAKQMTGVTDVQLAASNTRPEQTERRYNRPEDMIMQGNQFNPSGGMGDSILSKNGKKISKLKSGGEIESMYDPNTLYDDLGYEALDESERVKQYYQGGDVPKAANGMSNYMNTLQGGGSGFSGMGTAPADGTPWGMIGGMAGGIAKNLTGNDAGGMIGGGVGKGVGMIFGPAGGAIGEALGSAIGGLVDTNDNKMRKQQAATDRNMSGIAANSMAQAFQSQNQAFARNGDMIPFRAGGNLQSYTDPSEEAMETYEDGGEIQTHWGGEVEEMSYNPFLPGDGITYMPYGQSHEESDGNGNTGIGITFGDNPVEVERREPMAKLKDGSSGGESLVVYGNLKIPKYGVEMLGDKKAEGMKFKNYVNDLSKGEIKQNKIVENSTNNINSLKVKNSFDKLKFSGLEANILGANMTLKSIADRKMKAADLQSAINDTSEEYMLDADSLAKGKIKQSKESTQQYAKFGGQFKKAQVGIEEEIEPTQLEEVVIPTKLRPIPSITPAGFASSQLLSAPKVNIQTPEQRGYKASVENYEKEKEKEKEKENLFKIQPWQTMLYNEILNRTRPSDAEDLDPRQLMGEMNAMSNNQLEPVQAQQFSPQLNDFTRISLQDQMNEITAQTRAAQRMSGYNPAAQAMIAAQSYDAINKVKGEEFRFNQASMDKTFAENRATLNDAQIKNLGIFDQQYQRQAQALANTKEVTQTALNSISAKFAQNQLENRKLQAYENMYKFRYDKDGRLINMNPLQQWNTDGSLASKSEDVAPEGYEYEKVLKKKSKSSTAKNGSIVRSLKNI